MDKGHPKNNKNSDVAFQIKDEYTKVYSLHFNSSDIKKDSVVVGHWNLDQSLLISPKVNCSQRKDHHLPTGLGLLS